MIILSSGQTASARLPTVEERSALGLGERAPIWEITDASGSAKVYRSENTMVVAALSDN